VAQLSRYLSYDSPLRESRAIKDSSIWLYLQEW